jgi:hypothetical protein
MNVTPNVAKGQRSMRRVGNRLWHHDWSYNRVVTINSLAAPSSPTNSCDSQIDCPVSLSISRAMAPSTKRKRGHTQIRTNFPQKVVTRVEVTHRSNQRVLAKSKKFSVPVSNSPRPQNASSQTLDPLPGPLDDIPDFPAKKAQRGPSHSVSVCFHPPPFLHLVCTNGEVYRQAWSSGFRMKKSFPMRS